MSYDLHAKNKNVESIRIGAFSWPIMLQDSGMGYVLGYGKSRVPGEYVYLNGNNGSPVSNDGYRVTSEEAKIMAKIARGYVSVKRFINDQWEALDEAERIESEQLKINGKPLYEQQTGDGFLELIEKFAEFAERSGGFCIK